MDHVDESNTPPPPNHRQTDFLYSSLKSVLKRRNLSWYDGTYLEVQFMDKPVNARASSLLRPYYPAECYTFFISAPLIGQNSPWTHDTSSFKPSSKPSPSFWNRHTWESLNELKANAAPSSDTAGITSEAGAARRAPCWSPFTAQSKSSSWQF